MKQGLIKMVKNTQRALGKRSPEILTGIGIAGLVSTSVLAVRATPKALLLLEERRGELATDELPWQETVRTAWKCYIPSAIVGGVSIFCLIGASSVNVRRNAALATAYTLSESALREYQEKVIETIGERKEKTIKEAIGKDKLEKNPIGNREVIITEKGATLCYDALSGRYFKGDIEIIKKAVNQVNSALIDERYVSLNDFYYELGLENTTLGDRLGWNIDNGKLDISFSSHLASDGTPCLVMDYLVEPRYDYMR